MSRKRSSLTRRITLLILLISGGVTPTANSRADNSAISDVSGSSLHLRTGWFGGSFSASQISTRTYNELSTIDLEYEVNRSQTQSFLFRTEMVEDLSQLRTLYFGAFFGERYYFGSTNLAGTVSDSHVEIRTSPTWRFYGGAELGLAQAVVQEYGSVSQADSTLFVLGVNVGAIYQLFRGLGIELQAGISAGYGFTDVSVGALTHSVLLGVTFAL